MLKTKSTFTQLINSHAVLLRQQVESVMAKVFSDPGELKKRELDYLAHLKTRSGSFRTESIKKLYG